MLGKFWDVQRLGKFRLRPFKNALFACLYGCSNYDDRCFHLRCFWIACSGCRHVLLGNFQSRFYVLIGLYYGI